MDVVQLSPLNAPLFRLHVQYVCLGAVGFCHWFNSGLIAFGWEYRSCLLSCLHTCDAVGAYVCVQGSVTSERLLKLFGVVVIVRFTCQTDSHV